jgi:hypothetical protein
MRVELAFDNSLCLVEIERLELRITGFTDADYGNVLRYDSEITFCHEHRLSGSIVERSQSSGNTLKTDWNIQAGRPTLSRVPYLANEKGWGR